jgi:hypothetical protein
MVVARPEWQGRGRSRGIEMDFGATSVNTIQPGKIVRQRYFDNAEALEAGGLRE